MVKSVTVLLESGTVRMLVYVCHKTRIIHVLDRNGEETVVNAIGYVQEDIFDILQLAGKLHDYTWIIYTADGLTCSYSAGHFVHIPLHDNRLYFPFAKEMQIRRQTEVEPPQE